MTRNLTEDNRGGNCRTKEFSKVLLNFIERIEVETTRRGNNTWNNPSKLANFSKLEPSFAVFEASNKAGNKEVYERKRRRNCGFLLVARWEERTSLGRPSPVAEDRPEILGLPRYFLPDIPPRIFFANTRNARKIDIDWN